MASPWCRLWADMPNDPKWRTIAKVSKQRIGDVIAVYCHMMTCASSQTNATERGRTVGWRDEDVANALDLETEQVAEIRAAMQDRVLDGDYLKGWDRRQSLREDEGAAGRGKAFREREKAAKLAAVEAMENATERKRTQANDKTPLEVEVEVDKKSSSKSRGERLAGDWHPSPEETAFCKAERPDLRPSEVAKRFFDYWIAQPGVKGRKTDWTATWRNWVRNEKQVSLAQQPVDNMKGVI